MYSLIVSYPGDGEFCSTVVLDQSRFLEYTSGSIRDQLVSLSNEAIKCLTAWPALLMEEGKGEEVVHLVRIDKIEVDRLKIKVQISFIPGEKIILNHFLWTLRDSLDIGDFEFSRNHWAVKDRELLQVLEREGHYYQPEAINGFSDNQLPSPSRRQLLQARSEISKWGHTEIDDFLIEAGVTDMRAGREIGSRRDRANAILQYVLENPAALTIEGNLLSAFVYRCASSSELPSSEQDAAEFQMQDYEEQPRNSDRVPNRVFVVHGQNEQARELVTNVLSEVGLEAIVLHEQPNMGRHLLTKFIEEAELVTFAVVLMTDDDVGALKGGEAAPRARQNVILELGYFLSHLGSSGICALVSPGLETPSDFDGIVYISMDESGNWKTELLRELRAANLPIRYT